jgi:hypothetical protein
MRTLGYLAELETEVLSVPCRDDIV